MILIIDTNFIDTVNILLINIDINIYKIGRLDHNNNIYDNTIF